MFVGGYQRRWKLSELATQRIGEIICQQAWLSVTQLCLQISELRWLLSHHGWTAFYFMYDPKCSTTFPWLMYDAPVAFAWCTINAPVAFVWCTNHFVNKVEFPYIGWDGIRPLCVKCERSIVMCHFYMMMASNGNIFRVSGHLCGEFTGPRWIPRQRPGMRGFDVFFDLRPNKRLSRQW